MESVAHFQIAYLFAVDFILGHHDMLAYKVDILLLFIPMDICFLTEQEYRTFIFLICYQPHLVAYVQQRLCVRHELIAMDV